MDCSQLLESLDSLWFFTNIVSSPQSQNSDFFSNELEIVKENPSETFKGTVETQDQEIEALGKVQKCRKCGEFSAETETQEAEKQRRSGRRSKRSNNRKILGEIGRGNVTSSGFCFLSEEVRGCQNLQIRVKLPPLDDCLAMKQHLRTWAYAVACTVR